MTTREQRRAQVLTRVLEGAITLSEGALVLGLSLRQARRLKGQLARTGPAGLVHGNRGRPSLRRTDQAIVQLVVTRFRETYHDCNVQHYTELLAEREGVALSVETVRRILKNARLIAPRRRRPKHRSRRERMAAEGMLLQIDASPFRWLGPAGPRWSLVGAVDDATGDPVAAVFREQEDAAGYLLLLRQVVETRGIPSAVYRDRHLIFEASKRVRSTLEEDFAETRFPTQVGRLLAELGIESIAAYSPQAKGRVERSWRTQQDRLATELRLAGVHTIDEANAFLPTYLARYRLRFCVAARYPESAYVPMAAGTDLDRLFCFKYQRKVRSDNTIQFDRDLFQIPPGPDRLSYAHCVVEVQERLDRSLAIFYRGRELLTVPPRSGFAPLRARSRPSYDDASLPQPLQTEIVPVAPTPPPDPVPLPAKPERNHPWRRGIGADVARAQRTNSLRA